MTLFDGLYRYGGAALTWDRVGVTLTRRSDNRSMHAAWGEISGVRQIGGSPGRVQLLVRGHVPPADPQRDPFSIPVASDADAYRLVTSIAWRATPLATTRRRRWLRRA